MTKGEKVVFGLSSVVVLVLIVLLIAYWWSNTVPNRPASVASNAVFLWAPHVGLPAPRRGWWLACWESEGKDRCRLSQIDGTSEYEGDFIVYGHTGPLESAQLKILALRTERAKKLWIGNALVPLVYLENGAILVPAAKYDEGKRLLEEQQAAAR